MNLALVRASWTAVRRPALLVPAVLALVLVMSTIPVLDDGHALIVLRGVGLLLACAWVVTMDDPAGEVLAASPFTRLTRAAARALAGLGVVVPTWLVAAAVVEWRFDQAPVLGLGVEALALCAAGVALGAGLRAWAGYLSPSYVAVMGLLTLAFLANALPRGLRMTQEQIWGPPWEAAQIRWLALLLLAAGICAIALRDPLDSREPAGRGRSPRRTANRHDGAGDHRL